MKEAHSTVEVQMPKPLLWIIVPCYNVLHSFSKEYIVNDLVSLMQKKGLLT